MTRIHRSLPALFCPLHRSYNNRMKMKADVLGALGVLYKPLYSFVIIFPKIRFG